MRRLLVGAIVVCGLATVQAVDCHGDVQLLTISRGANANMPGSPIGVTNTTNGHFDTFPPTYIISQGVGAFAPSIVRASHSSDISTSNFSASGFANAFANTGGGNTPMYADSFFDVFFDVTIPQDFTLNGSLFLDEIGGGSSSAILTLVGPVSLSFLAGDTLTESGVLTTGSYHLSVFASATGAVPISVRTGNYDFAMTFANSTAVPELSAAMTWSVLVSCIGLVCIGRRVLQKGST